ncbi:uncharacterized protein LOC110466876 [Mizuhopecten yessoensis]|uniref:Uncharacterized protein n=1 Tax=Mizuhopecten yessoensis TaxID=6573 RepID=A0A210PNE7_MIZYE|nr:uncharacterized protein LOC110466876 [Mizuhopecten yessoensis]OWF37983.1 hypothetical protein KP79_PYT14303 [Mizuhopecten yessoensis]
MMLRYLLVSCVLVQVIAYVTSASVKAKCGKYNHGDTWNHDTLTCLSYRCRDGTIYPKYTGCVKDDKCYDVNQKWKKDCSNFQCVSYTHGNMTVFETKLDMQCTVNTKGKNKCKPNGSEWKEGCDFKRCDVTTSQSAQTAKMQYSAQVINVKQGCQVGKKCYYNGDNWFQKCVWYTCKVTSLFAKAVGVPGCTNKKKCFKVGTFRSYKNKNGCYKYLCKQTNEEVGWKLISAGCNDKGQCRDNKSTWRDKDGNCMEKKCVSIVENGNQKLSIEEKPYGCKDGKICRDFGKTWMDSGCSLHKCRLSYGAAFNDVLRTVCKDKTGVCKDWNSGAFEGLVKKGNKKAYFKNCKCQKDGENGSVMTCTDAAP